MLPRLVAVLLLCLCSPASAQDGAKAQVLGDLLKNPEYLNAWQSMLANENTPEWLKAYTGTLEGPPTPNIPVDIDGQSYTMGFTCKPNECGDNQLFVLFSPDASKAWALMATPETEIVWLGHPDERIQSAIKGALKR